MSKRLPGWFTTKALHDLSDSVLPVRANISACHCFLAQVFLSSRDLNLKVVACAMVATTTLLIISPAKTILDSPSSVNRDVGDVGEVEPASAFNNEAGENTWT